jgi:DUF1680 family protein
VDLAIEPERAAAFDLLLRVPKWCKNARVFVNGEALAGSKPTPGAFLKITRTWKRSNTVTLVLDMRGRAVRRDFAKSAGKPAVTLERGPLLLALTTKLNPGLELEKMSPVVGPEGAIKLDAMAELKAVNASSIRFRANATTTRTHSGNDKPNRATIFVTPYAYCGVSDKPVPPPKEGVFNVYSEDGVGQAVRVEFPITGSEAARR